MPYILIVEDHSATRTALAQLLSGEGYEVAEAADGGAAVALLHSRRRPGLVLLDMLMPGMDGWQFLQARHSDPALAAAPVVVLTAASEFSPSTARALGADDVLLKPVDAEDLLDAVRRYFPPAVT
jgi:CheY-like chemotaxis protein